ncbi:hypothetical protein SDC9_175188 [bioreactor metagenome]|uniref:Uncharacterized protein n=1 Tax=bioreactor metagenome TaxID=1076179 RepID=A0A645GUP7_9ZZZZ
MRRDAALAVFVNFTQQRVGGGKVALGAQKVGDIPTLKIALGRNAVARAEQRSVRFAEQFFNLVRRKEVIFSLDALGIGVLRRVKPAVRRVHFAAKVLEYALDDVTVDVLADFFICEQVCHRQKRIVVEHFFKMGHEPVAVGRVARKAAADMVEYAAAEHAHQRFLGHLRRGI